jgi:hypothetical protein
VPTPNGHLPTSNRSTAIGLGVGSWHWAIVALTFGILSVVWTWPLATRLSSRVAHDPGDPILNTWILWWNAQRVPFTQAWWDAPLFFPMRDGLALSEHLAGLSPFSTPLILAGVSPLGAYNVLLILTFALSAFFAYALALRLTGSPLAAGCAALAFGFSPYRVAQLGHLQVLASFWMPVVLLALHAYVETRRPRWLIVFATAWLLQSLSNGYYLLFLPVLIAAWLAWFVRWRTEAAPGVRLAAAWIAASLLLVPILLKYQGVHRMHGFSRSVEESRAFSATFASFTHTSPLLPVWPFVPANHTEDLLFPGVTALVLVVAAGVASAARGRRALAEAWRTRSPLLFYASAAGLMWALAFGPAPDGSGLSAALYPYTALSWLPGFDGLRAPARFAMLATLCAAVAGAIAFTRLVPSARGGRAAFAAAVAAGLVADGWMSAMPLFPPPSRAVLPDVPHAVVVELPPDRPDVGVTSMYRSMFHGRPVVSGYSGHLPRHTLHIAMALRRRDPSPLMFLAEQRPLIIALDDRHDAEGRLEALVRELPGIQWHSTTGGGHMYVMPRMPATRVAEGGIEWPGSYDEPNGRVDLGEVRVIRTIGFPMRHRFLSLHPRIAVDVSPDGAAWTRAWEDWTGAPAVAGVLHDPLLAPVRIPLPDVAARYVRVAPAPAWLWREIRFYGP